MEIAEKLFPSCADGRRRIGTDVFGDYLSRAMWSFEAIGAFGRNLWPFSFSGSGRRSSSSALPWKDIHSFFFIRTFFIRTLRLRLTQILRTY